MIVLGDTTESLELVTTAAQSTDYTVSFADLTSTTFVLDDVQGNISTATTTTILSAPAASTQRQVKQLTVVNRGAASQTVTLQRNISATTRFIAGPIPLAVGERIEYVDGVGLRVYDNTGGLKAGTYNEDAPHVSGDPGVSILGVRRDADTSPVSADGDYHAPIFDANGNLKVNVKVGTTAVTGTVTVADGGGSLTVDNTVLSVVGGGTEAAAQRVTIASDSTGVLSVDDNGGVLSVDDAGGSLTVDGTVAATQSGTWTLGANSGVDIGDVTINNAAGGAAVNIQDGGNSITVDGTVAVSGTVTVDTEFPVAETPADNLTNATAAPRVNSLLYGFDGTTWDRIRGDSTNGLQVDLGVNNDVRISDGTDIADVLDLTNSNPLTVAIVDGAGTQITSFGGGTQYTEDAVAATDPVGTTPVMTRRDTPASLVSANLDVISQQATQYGAAYTQILTSSGSFVDSFGGGTEYTEDAAAAADPLGKATILVRQDTPATVTSTNGDNVAQRGTNYGAAYSQIVTSAGAFVDTFGGGSQFAVDAVAGGTDQGTLALVVRDDALATLTPIDGDYTQMRVTSTGRLWTSATIDAALPAGSANIGDVDVLTVPAPLSTTGGGTEATALRVTVANDSTGVLSVDDNGGTLTVDNTVLSVVGGGTEATAQRVTIANDSTGVLSVDDNGGSLTVDGTVAVSGTVTVDTEFPAAETPADNLTNATAAPRVNALGYVFDGTTWDRALGNSTDGTLVNLGTNNDVTVTGTVTANLAAGTNTNEVVGDVAQDVAMAGNPLGIGMRASTATPTAMSADGDSVYAWSDLNGAQMIRSRPAATATLANVAGSASSVTLRAAATGRLGLMIYNDSTALLYVKFGATASTSSFTVRLGSQQYYELPSTPAIYTGVVDGIWASATGNARVTEITT